MTSSTIKIYSSGCVVGFVGTRFYKYYDFVRICFDTTHNLEIKVFEFPMAEDFVHIALIPPMKMPIQNAPAIQKPLLDYSSHDFGHFQPNI